MMDPWEEMMASFRGDEGEHQTLPVVASVHVRAHESVCRCVCVCVFFLISFLFALFALLLKCVEHFYLVVDSIPQFYSRSICVCGVCTET